MPKTIVVVFTDNNARVLVNPLDLKAFEGAANAVINPDLWELRGIPPHFWKLVEGKILPMTPEECAARQSQLDKSGADNVIKLVPRGSKPSRRAPWLAIGVAVALLILGAYLIKP